MPQKYGNGVFDQIKPILKTMPKLSTFGQNLMLQKCGIYEISVSYAKMLFIKSFKSGNCLEMKLFQASRAKFASYNYSSY